MLTIFMLLQSGAWALEGLDVPYKAAVKGLRDKAVTERIRDLTQTFLLEKRPTATVGQLRRRAEKDIPRIEQVLESYGYYDGRVSVELDTEKNPYRVVFVLAAGEAYRLRSVQVTFSGQENNVLSSITTRLKTNARAIASDVLAEEQRLLRELQQRGYPFPKLVRRLVTLDRAQHKVDLVLDFDPGVDAVYGDFSVEGLQTIRSSYIRRKLTWKPGDDYDATQLSDFESLLLSSGLFGTARVEALPPEGAQSHAIPIRISVTERDQQTVRLGVGYSDVGPAARAQWEHRNLLGGGEKLETTVKWSPVETNLRGQFERPGFLGGNQSLLLDVDVIRETPDAYDADKATASVVVQRLFDRHFLAGTGVRYKHSLVEQFTDVERYSHVILPFYADADFRDDRLNPTSGGQVLVDMGFYEDMNGSDSFLKTEVSGRLYTMLWDGPRLSAAGRLSVGSIDGTSVGNVPADERFYAGGGGSIRGYEYQMVGPVVDGQPVGGAHLLEFSAELRAQPGQKLGYVAFLDGGTVYNDLAEDADRALRYGAGVGLRWFTTIGPLRVDVAYPLNPADEQTERLQFYISLGQAF